MDLPTLSPAEVRVLGSLIEKEMTTPEYYPLSLNALTNACNQKSNRDPVMNLEESEVMEVLDRLRREGLAMQAHGEGSRVAKFRHSMAEKVHLEPEELAILAELMLRGPQTVGELRGRADRMHPFADLQTVESVLQDLMDREPALAVRLPRQPGRKESRYAHRLAGEPEAQAEGGAAFTDGGEKERLERLEAVVASLKEEVEALRREMADFRSQLE